MIEIDIVSLAYGGDAVGRLDDGRTAFVRGACPGDRVAVHITEDHPRFVKAIVGEVITASADRVTAPCPYFGVCGGCQWQHVAYPAQLVAKRQAVVDALQRIGKVQDAAGLVGSIVPSPEVYGYRNKIELVADARTQRLSLGFHRPASAEVVPIESCLLLPKAHQRAPRALAGALRYLSGDSPLGITRVGLRAAHGTRDAEVALWTPPGAFPRAAASKTLGQALALTSLVRLLHKDTPGSRNVSKVEVLSGKGFWKERLAGCEFLVSAPSFFQVNTRLTERMVEAVLGALDPDGSDRVLDLYSGVGTFTLPLAERAGEVVAVESYGSAVRDLRRNLENAGLPADVIGGDAAREIATIGRFDAALVDPPRTGLSSSVIDALARTRPRTLAYVSCDPATLARDAAALGAAGMQLSAVTPFDLFPQSFHVETVALFEPVS